MKGVPGFHAAGDVAQAPALAGSPAPSIRSPEFKNTFRHLTATALLSMEQCAYHIARRWVEDDQVGRRHTRLFHDFSATATAAKLDRSRQWCSHGFAELEAADVFRQRSQRRNPATGQFDEPRPKLMGACPQFWQLVKAKYAYICIQAGLPIRNKKGRIIYQDPKQTLAEHRGQLPTRLPRPEKVAHIRHGRPVPEPSEAEQWAAMTPSQQRWVLQVNLPGFSPPG